MYLAEGLQQKWAPVLDHEDMPKIKDSYRRAVTAVLLENQEKAMAEEQGMNGFGFQSLQEAPAPVNAAPTASSSGNVQYQDPILISMIRRAMPNLMAYDVCGVQPMSGPTGLIFAMRPKYDSQAGSPGGEAFYNAPDTPHSGDGGTDMVGAGNSFNGMYISNGMTIYDNELNGNHYISTSFNGLMAGPVTVNGVLTVDGNYVVV